MAETYIPTGPAQPNILSLEKVNPHPNNYVKAWVKDHYEAGHDRSLPLHFIVQFDDTIQGSAELARRKLEDVVLPWIESKKRNTKENNGHGYSPEVYFSVFREVVSRLHDKFGWPFVGQMDANGIAMRRKRK
jgi:hypothetical protein